LAAVCEVVAEHGATGATVAHIVARAGVSRRTFYELFADREDCFLAAFDQAVERAAVRVRPAWAAGGQRWRARVRGALVALLGFFDEEPELGVLCIVHALGAGPTALTRRAQVVRTLVAAVEEGRLEARGDEMAPLTAEGVVGAVLAVLHVRLHERSRTEHGSQRLTSLTSPLMAMIVLPYLGSAAAARELARPAPKQVLARSAASDPLKGLDMRLTYRTLRVLLAIDAQPGASNRQVAKAAGIVDQGQTSKLLQRLEHLGLVDNAGSGNAGRGGPNAWRLSARGEELRRVIYAQELDRHGVDAHTEPKRPGLTPSAQSAGSGSR
jgi:AcrR family transcriptional regulator